MKRLSFLNNTNPAFVIDKHLTKRSAQSVYFCNAYYKTILIVVYHYLIKYQANDEEYIRKNKPKVIINSANLVELCEHIFQKGNDYMIGLLLKLIISKYKV